MVEVKKKDGETTEGLIRRFTKKVQQSGVLIRAKKGRFHEQERNKRKLREDALRRRKIKEEKEYLRKIGKLEEVENKRPKRYR